MKYGWIRLEGLNLKVLRLTVAGRARDSWGLSVWEVRHVWRVGKL
jgi:hypothetical protein